jgi:nucleoside phosphorylase
MPFVTGVLGGRTDLAADAQLLHDLCFDRVHLETPRLTYEPRWSCQCRPCAAMWVASKSGAVMRIDLDTPTGRPVQRWLPGNREARTIYHVHDGTALGGGSYLLIGRDDGALDIVADNDPSWTLEQPAQRRRAPVARFHLDSWHPNKNEDVVVGKGFDRAGSDDRGRDGTAFTMGITAIDVFARPGSPATLDILVATRFPSLYVLTATGGRLRLRRRMPMPGWIQWIIRQPKADDVRIACISRGGDIVYFAQSEFGGSRELNPLPPTALSLLPTAAMPFDDTGLLLGTTTGLFLIRGERATAVPITRAPVLSLDRARVMSGTEEHTYIAMGLDDGRLRVADADLIRALADGNPRPPVHNHNFTLEMGDAVLAVETLQPHDPPSDTVYVLAVLRDHSLRLFQVTSQHTVRARVSARWQAHVHGRGGTRLATELKAVGAPPPAGVDPDAWKCMLVDVVLPTLLQERPTHSERREIVRLACAMAEGADRVVLLRLSLSIGPLTGNDVDLLLALSRAVLRAERHSKDPHWWAFIDSHLRELNALTRDVHDRDHARARIVAWTRFVRKYLLLGDTFAGKEISLVELVKQNYETHKFFDALIYQTRLLQRCYDLHWETRVDNEIVGLHVVECSGDRRVAVVVANDGTLALYDVATGRRLKMRSGDSVVDVLEPCGSRAVVQARACAVARNGAGFRIVLSCSGADAPSPGLSVFDVDWPDGADVELTATCTPVECADEEQVRLRPRVYALQQLPGRADAFLVGLETRASPVGLLRYREPGVWALELARYDGPEEAGFRPVDPSSLAPGKAPTRALAVVAVDDAAARYLAVMGSDDGLVRAVSFDRDAPAPSWQLNRWDRVADAITSIVLGRHPAPSTPDLDESLFSCYVGTDAGDTLALSILARDKPGASTAVVPLGDYDAQPLWRDAHDGSIVAVQLWDTPLYDLDEVLVVVTQRGRFCVYNHTPNPGKERTSASLNYFFHGMRFDRVSMPGRLRAIATVQGRPEFVAAGAGGTLYKGELLYLRDSVHRKEPESRPHPLNRELPAELWARLHHLFSRTDQHRPFSVSGESGDDVELKLDLCDLIRLEGGALSNYALRERLTFREPWRDLGDVDPAEAELLPKGLHAKARQLLDRLDPERPDDTERIKVVIKSLCRAFLFHPPDAVRSELLAAPGAVPRWHGEVVTVCKLASDYIARDLAYSTSTSARLRIVVIKELLRVSMLRHIAIDDDHGRQARQAVVAALDDCLRDDDRLVRTETLRAVAVMLRNVGVMADAVPGDRARFVAVLFPRGPGSVTWLLELIVEGLQRFPGFTRRSALVSNAWYLISTLLPLFRIFPDHSLALCDYLIRAGLGIEVVAMCFRSFRRRRTAAIRSRIAHLYLIPALEPKHARDEFIDCYDTRKPGHRRILEELCLPPTPAPPAAGTWRDREWYEIEDAEMADRRLHLLDQLARMWSVRDDTAIRDVAPLEPITGGPAPLGALEDVVVELASIAGELAKESNTDNPSWDTVRALERLAALGERHGSNIDGRSPLTAPVRTVVAGIVTAWRDVYTPLTKPGDAIGGHRLGRRIAEGRFATLFEMDDPGLRDRYVIKVLRRSNAPSAAERFLEGARFNKQLCEESPDKAYIAVVHRILDLGLPLAYVMAKHGKPLEEYLEPDFHEAPHAVPWTELAAEHIGRALRAAHALARWHGDVAPAAILVAEHEGPVFRLGDFDLAHTDDPHERAAVPGGLVPEYLSQKCRTADPLARRQWDDLVALCLILYRMLTGKALDPRGTEDLREHLEHLDALAASPQLAERPRALRVIAALARVFREDRQPFDIRGFLSAVLDPGDARPDSRYPRADVAVLIALDEEFEQLRSLVDFRKKFVDPRGGYYFEFEVSGAPHRCVAKLVGDMGIDEARGHAEHMLDRWQPAVAVMIGVAASLDTKVKLGDVVVATQIDAFDANLKAVSVGGRVEYQHRGRVFRGDRALLQEIKDLRFAHEAAYKAFEDECADDCDALLPADLRRALQARDVLGRPPSVQRVHLASGSIVGASSEFKDWLRQRDQALKALEMESAALVAAAECRQPHIRTLVVRGISDFADDQKSELDGIGGGMLRRHAMRNATRFLCLALRLNILPRHR